MDATAEPLPAAPVPDGPVLDGPVLDGPVLDDTILADVVLADAAPDDLVPDDAGPDPVRPLSAWAVTAFAAGLIGLFPLGLVAGAGALRRMRRRGQRGIVLAVGGLAMSAAWVLAVSLGVAAVGGPAGLSRLASLDSHQRAAAPHAARGQVGVLTLAAGDCFDSPSAIPATVAVLSCTRPHSAQVFARFRLAGSNLHYPGQAGVQRLAQQGCRARERNLGQGLAPDDVTVRVLFPLAGPWLTGQRTVSCVILSPRQALIASLIGP